MSAPYTDTVVGVFGAAMFACGFLLAWAIASHRMYKAYLADLADNDKQWMARMKQQQRVIVPPLVHSDN